MTNRAQTNLESRQCMGDPPAVRRYRITESIRRRDALLGVPTGNGSPGTR